MPLLQRIVKMTFRPEEVALFQEIFAEASLQIRAFPGCKHLELWQDQKTSSILFTYSLWEDEEALERYRHSELFAKTWARTKPLFADRPAAWSVQTLVKLP